MQFESECMKCSHDNYSLEPELWTILGNFIIGNGFY